MRFRIRRFLILRAIFPAARAPLMYLAGMDIYDIMKITGHSTPMMLNKYIKADQLEVVEKITDKYDYSD